MDRHRDRRRCWGEATVSSPWRGRGAADSRMLIADANNDSTTNRFNAACSIRYIDAAARSEHGPCARRPFNINPPCSLRSL
jgi:hypothetical protein